MKGDCMLFWRMMGIMRNERQHRDRSRIFATLLLSVFVVAQ